jgi:phosphohistidine phosphatase
MVIGHNPGMHEFAAAVAGSGPRLALLEEKFPTGALAVLEFDVEDWHLPPGTGRLRDFALPRDLE